MQVVPFPLLLVNHVHSLVHHQSPVVRTFSLECLFSNASTRATFSLSFRFLAFSVVFYRAIAVEDDLQGARNSHLFQMNPKRYLALEFVKAFCIHSASPFSLAEHEPVRRFLSLMGKDFDVKALNNRLVSMNYGGCYAVLLQQTSLLRLSRTVRPRVLVSLL